MMTYIVGVVALRGMKNTMKHRRFVGFRVR